MIVIITGAESAKKLMRKGALLDAAVSAGITSIRGLARVLDTNAINIYSAIDRRTESVDGLEPLKRRKWDDGLSSYVKATVKAWWHDHTRVSYEKKHVCYYRQTGKPPVEHPTHFLTETQVFISNSAVFYISYVGLGVHKYEVWVWCMSF